MNKSLNCLGLMSGTSGDGVDASVINSDGKGYYKVLINKFSREICISFYTPYLCSSNIYLIKLIFSEKIICVDNLSYASDYEQIKDLPIEFCNANIIDQHYCDYILKNINQKLFFILLLKVM